jgi:hypothetical protein
MHYASLYRCVSITGALFCFLPAIATAQGITLNPAAPVVSAGQNLTLTTDRPVVFKLWGSGSIGTVHANSVVYTAPPSFYAQHVLAGCMVLPNDSVFNTRIDLLPVSANSALWTPSAIPQPVSFAFKLGSNVVDSSTPTVAQQFLATTQINGTPFPLPARGAEKRENGADTTDGSTDHHMIVVNRKSCQFYETNQEGMAIKACPKCTADSGWTYQSTSYAQPGIGDGGGTADGAGLPLAALTLHLSELEAGSVNHALRFTACSACMGDSALWPATKSNGTQSGGTPAGARFRLKASFDISGFPIYQQVVLTALKRYGMILAGSGVSSQISVSSDVTEDSRVYSALQQLAGAGLTSWDFEAVDESRFILSPTSSAVNPSNGFQGPANFALLTITDAVNPKNSIQVPIALQAVAVGTPDPAMVVQAGTPAFQIPVWVTGTTNQNVTWSISQPTGAGSVSASSIYTAPATVTSPQTIVLQAISVADPRASTSIRLTIIPAGVVRIDSGSAVSLRDYTGQTWMSDLGFETGNYSVTPAGTPSNAWPASAIWNSAMYTQGDDIVYKFHVPNGYYGIELMFGVGGCSGSYAGQSSNAGSIWGPLDLQLQGSTIFPGWNLGQQTRFTCQTPATASMTGQVTDTTLTIAVRATGGDGQHSTPLLNGLLITPLSSGSPFQISVKPGQTSATLALGIQQFDSKCGTPGYNCRQAFQNAFSTLAQAGGGTLSLPAGTFLVDFPEVLQNVRPVSSYFSANSLIVVPPNTMILGHTAADGTPDTIIQWRITSIPVFVFAKASGSGMNNIHAQFIGLTSVVFPYGDTALLGALNFHPSFPHENQMSGGTDEMFSFAYVFESNKCQFNNDVFDSATRDNSHVFGFAINVKGTGLATAQGAGGLGAPAVGTQITNIKLYDFVVGLLVSGQQGATIQNIYADRRGSTAGIVPGHLLYVAVQSQIDAGGKTTDILSTNLTVQNITEGPDTYSNMQALGTLAIKGVNGALINNIMSQHPVGLIQSIYEAQNVVFSNMTWQSNFALCSDVPANCNTAVIYSILSLPGVPPTKNLTFNNIKITSTIKPVTLHLMGDNLVVNGLVMQTPATFLPTQTNTNAVLGVSNSIKATVSNYSFVPDTSSYSSKANYNTPLTVWSTGANVKANLTISWPQALAVPRKGSYIITPISQNTTDVSNVLNAVIVSH